MQAFGRRLADHQPQIGLKARIGGRHRGARYLFAKPRFDQRPRRDDGLGKLAVAFQRVGELIAAGGQRSPDTPEMPDQPFGCGVGKRSGKGLEEVRQDR
ncbi:enoyl-[acyl-carrier-protein] reductase [Sphingopyxis sp. EG6]|nr:enoyl-[acyl-carrier-protein] reductase [Sphingopyxis sp. EG6]